MCGESKNPLPDGPVTIGACQGLCPLVHPAGIDIKPCAETCPAATLTQATQGGFCGDNGSPVPAWARGRTSRCCPGGGTGFGPADPCPVTPAGSTLPEQGLNPWGPHLHLGRPGTDWPDLLCWPGACGPRVTLLSALGHGCERVTGGIEWWWQGDRQAAVSLTPRVREVTIWVGVSSELWVLRGFPACPALPAPPCPLSTRQR